MIRPRQIFHLLRINRVLVRHGLDSLIYRTHFFRLFRLFLYLLPWYWFGKQTAPLGARIREALIELGPIFVKFGQILSTRRDLLPDDIAVELSLLQDRVPPFPGTEAQEIIETALGKPVAELFDDFSVEPLASASIAQVHAARLKSGEEVVIKVLRPGIEPVIRRDLELMYYLAELAQRFWRDGRRLRPVEVVSEFDRVIHDELDLVREAANAAQLRRNFQDNKLLYVPDVYWDLVCRNVMVMERIHGTPVSQVDELVRRGIDIKQLAEDGVEIFYTQVFSHNFFHADMHPGNIFVADDGHYIAVDFGIMGTLTEEDQRYLAENFIAFFNRDYHRVAELHVQSGWVPAGTRIDEFEAAIRSVCEPNFNRPLKDISFGQVLLRLFETARRFDMEVQPQLVLLQKTLLNIEGLGRQLYPDLDLWQTAKPFLERWMQEQVGIKRLLRRLSRDLPLMLERLPEMPDLVYQFLKQNFSQRQDTAQDADKLDRLRRELAATRKSRVHAILGGSCALVATILFVLPQPATTLHYTLGTGFGAAGLLLAWLSTRH